MEKANSHGEYEAPLIQVCCACLIARRGLRDDYWMKKVADGAIQDLGPLDLWYQGGQIEDRRESTLVT